MEKSTDQRETHDFMNVESFSQLPFIRPAVPPVNKDKAIRLFGKEFGGEYSSATATATTTTMTEEYSSESAAAAVAAREEANNSNNNNKDIGVDNGESTRKFECHYCCRNFPTSQALGGHQNAHKRERQHAKRAHLQSAMVHAAAAGAEAHVYGLMNYHRLGSVPTTPLAYHHHHNHSWTKSTNSYNTSTNTNSRFYGGTGGPAAGSYNNNSQPPPPINGSPLALWRIPAAHSSPTTLISRVVDDSMHPHHNPLPLFGNGNGNEEFKMKPPQVSSASQTLFGYDSTKPNKMQDPVSLDLHL